MVNRLYVVLDLVAKESGPVFEARNDGVAHRNYNAMLEKNGAEKREFELLYLGVIDHDKNKILALEEAEIIVENVEMETER